MVSCGTTAAFVQVVMIKKITWIVLTRYTAQALSVFSNILLARYLGVDGFGEYALASSVLLIGNAFSNFGMDMILIRKLAISDNPSLLADGLWLQLFLSMIYILGVSLIGLFADVPTSLKIYTLSLLPLSFYSIFTIVVRARQQLHVFSVAQVLTAILQFMAVLILWLLQGDVKILAVLFLIAQSLVAIWGFMCHISNFPLFDFSLYRSINLLRSSFRMAMIGTLRLVYEKLVITLLPALLGLSMTGGYSAASRVMDAGKLGHYSAFTVIYPEMARNENFGKRMRGLQSLLGMALLISTFLFLFAEPITLILFGSEFLSAIPPLRVLAWVVIPYVTVTYLSLGFVALEIEKPVLSSLLITLIVLLMLFVLLTLKFNLIGSAAAVLTAEVVHALILSLHWRKHVLSKLSG